MCFTQYIYHVPCSHWHRKTTPCCWAEPPCTFTVDLFPDENPNNRCPTCVADVAALQTQFQHLDATHSPHRHETPVFRSVNYRPSSGYETEVLGLDSDDEVHSGQVSPLSSGDGRRRACPSPTASKHFADDEDEVSSQIIPLSQDMGFVHLSDTHVVRSVDWVRCFQPGDYETKVYQEEKAETNFPKNCEYGNKRRLNQSGDDLEHGLCFGHVNAMTWVEKNNKCPLW